MHQSGWDFHCEILKQVSEGDEVYATASMGDA